MKTPYFESTIRVAHGQTVAPYTFLHFEQPGERVSMAGTTATVYARVAGGPALFAPRPVPVQADSNPLVTSYRVSPYAFDDADWQNVPNRACDIEFEVWATEPGGVDRPLAFITAKVRPSSRLL